jgi:hypothetical protein
MANWLLSNLVRKSAIDVQIYEKDGVVISLEEGYVWVQWSCESETRPQIDLNNNKGFLISEVNDNWEIDEMGDSAWVTWNFPEGLTANEQERIQEAWAESYNDAMDDLGWERIDGQQWLHGPLKLINQTTGEEWRGE